MAEWWDSRRDESWQQRWYRLTGKKPRGFKGTKASGNTIASGLSTVREDAMKPESQVFKRKTTVADLTRKQNDE